MHVALVMILVLTFSPSTLLFIEATEDHGNPGPYQSRDQAKAPGTDHRILGSMIRILKKRSTTIRPRNQEKSTKLYNSSLIRLLKKRSNVYTGTVQYQY